MHIQGINLLTYIKSSSEYSSNNLVDLTGENSQLNFDNQDSLKDFQNYKSGDDTSTNDELYDEDDS